MTYHQSFLIFFYFIKSFLTFNFYYLSEWGFYIWLQGWTICQNIFSYSFWGMESVKNRTCWVMRKIETLEQCHEGSLVLTDFFFTEKYKYLKKCSCSHTWESCCSNKTQRGPSAMRNTCSLYIKWKPEMSYWCCINTINS